MGFSCGKPSVCSSCCSAPLQLPCTTRILYHTMADKLNFNDKVVIATGAGGGLGKA